MLSSRARRSRGTHVDDVGPRSAAGCDVAVIEQSFVSVHSGIAGHAEDHGGLSRRGKLRTGCDPAIQNGCPELLIKRSGRLTRAPSCQIELDFEQGIRHGPEPFAQAAVQGLFHKVDPHGRRWARIIARVRWTAGQARCMGSQDTLNGRSMLRLAGPSSPIPIPSRSAAITGAK